MEGILNKHFSLVRNIYILLAVALLLLILFPVYIKEDGASATTGTATASTTSLTIASGKNTASVAITPTNTSGAFAASSSANKAEFNVSTNNYTGYTLAITASDDTGNLVNTTTSDTIASIATNLTESSFNTSANNNKWGFKPNKYVSNNTVITNTGDGSVYLPSPTTTPTLLDKTNVANTVANNYTIALGIRADHNTYAGTYSKTFTLVATANPITYTINYNKNTADSVSNMPTTQSGTTSATGITLANNTPERDSYLFLGWCNVQPTTTDYVDSCSGGTTYQPGGAYGIDQTTANTTTLYAMWKINSFTQTTQVRYEDVNGNWGDYSTVETKQVAYGSNYSWNTSQISGFNSAMYQSASVDSYTVTEAKTNQVSIYRNTFTCTKQYRLETESGGWDSYTSDGTINNVRYGGSCSYSKTVTDYRGASNAANGAQGSTSASNITADTTLSLDFYRNTYTLTVSAGANTTVPSNSGAGTYRWGQTVTVYINKSANTTCTYYDTPSWSQSGTAGTFSSTSGTSTTFTMGKGNVTLTAISSAFNIYWTITLSKGTGVNGITIDGTKNIGTSVYLTCGQHTITAPATNFDSGYEFSSWAISGSASLSSTSSATTTMTVNGEGRLTLNGKQSCTTTTFSGTMQSMAGASISSYCDGSAGTLTDNRSGNKTYTVAKIGGLLWMTRNLDLPGGTTLTSANSNVSSNYTLPASSTSGFSNTSTAYVYNSNSTTCTSSSPCYSYYSYAAATAGTNPSSGNATSDICPKGWRLPTQAEYNTLINTYTTGATLTASPWYGVYAGGYGDGSFHDGGSYGYYWSSTALTPGAEYLNFNSSNANIYRTNKNYGFSVRCVLK